MKLLFSSDLHGDEAHYTRLLNVARQNRPQLIILGGDMLPDDSALEPDQMGHGQPAYVRGPFRKYIASLREASGCESVMTIFGNHDWGSSVTAMAELEGDGLLNVLSLEKPTLFKGISFLGYSSTPPTPWFVKDFERLDQPKDKPPLLGGARWDARFNRPCTLSATALFGMSRTMVAELADLKRPPDPWVFVAHAPPAESLLDRYYGNLAWGSKAVRDAIEKHQPMLSLHGHIHQAHEVTGHFMDKIGRTVAVNPGQTHSKLNHVLIEVDPAKGAVLNVTHGQAT
ncbi:MAG TPA: metallophosphoesterase [Phycisphaerae bacterium]|nr:metallophosphoesterase [Phycisphaerae bacterium]